MEYCIDESHGRIIDGTCDLLHIPRCGVEVLAVGLALKASSALILTPLVRIPARAFSSAVITQTTRWRNDPELSVPIGYNSVEAEVSIKLREDRIRQTQNIAALTTMFYATYAIRREIIIPRALAREAVAAGVARAAAQKGGGFLSRAKWLIRGGSKALGWLAIADGIVLLTTYGYSVLIDDTVQPTTITGEAFDALFGEDVAEFTRDKVQDAIEGGIDEDAALAAVLAFYVEKISVNGKVALDGYSIGKIFSMSIMSSFEEGILDIELTDLILYIIGACVAHVVVRSWINQFKRSTT